MEEIRNRLLMIGFSPESVMEIVSELPDPEEQAQYTEWQEEIYRERCSQYLDEVMD